jgi:Zn-dependent M32 family carboxypeptidase
MPNSDDMNIERELAKLTSQPQRGNGRVPVAANPVMEACMQAADKIRAISEQEIAEGEKVAKQLRDIGETFAKRMAQLGEEARQTIQHAADEVTKLRAVPKENAEEAANVLTEIASAEAARHAHVSEGITDMRSALDRIANVSKNVPPVKPRGDPRIDQIVGDFK